VKVSSKMDSTDYRILPRTVNNAVREQQLNELYACLLVRVPAKKPAIFLARLGPMPGKAVRSLAEAAKMARRLPNFSSIAFAVAALTSGRPSECTPAVESGHPA